MSPLYLIEDYANEVRIELSNNIFYLLDEDFKCQFENKIYQAYVNISNRTLITCTINPGFVSPESLK